MVSRTQLSGYLPDFLITTQAQELLGPSLYATAQLFLNNPGLTAVELGERHVPPIAATTANARLRAIRKLVQKYHCPPESAATATATAIAPKPQPVQRTNPMASRLVAGLHGDKEALSEVFRADYPYLVEFAYRLTGDAYLAQDLASTVFVRVLRSPDAYADLGNDPRAWFTTILKNLIRDVFKRRKEILIADLAEATEPHDASLPPDPAEIVTGGEAELLASWVRDALPDRSWNVIRRRYLEGNRVDSVAESLGRSTGAVKKELHVTRKALRQRFPGWDSLGIAPIHPSAVLRMTELPAEPVWQPTTSRMVFAGAVRPTDLWTPAYAQYLLRSVANSSLAPEKAAAAAAFVRQPALWHGRQFPQVPTVIIVDQRLAETLVVPPTFPRDVSIMTTVFEVTALPRDFEVHTHQGRAPSVRFPERLDHELAPGQLRDCLLAVANRAAAAARSIVGRQHRNDRPATV